MRCVYCQVLRCNACKISPFYGLDFDDAPFSELTIEAVPPEKRIELVKDLSISGVQQKYSLVFQEDSGKLIMRNRGGQFSLKPEIKDDRFVNSLFSVENEHISMRLTEKMGLNTALNCIVTLGGDDLGYVTKRFDYIDEDTSYLMGDFGQVMAIDATGIGKYNPTVEEMGRALDQRLGASLVLKAELFRRVVANFILCNGDAHVKNYSLIQNRNDDDTRVFSPVYDVMNTIIHIPGGRESALGLTNDTRDQKYGLTKESFDALASRLGLRIRARNSTYSTLLRRMDNYEVSLFKYYPGMNHEIRNQYIDLVDERLNVIRK